MKIFVAYPFDQPWIESHIIPQVQTYGVEVCTGKELAGGVIDEEVRQRIADADGMIAFLCRRDRLEGKGRWTCSGWVVQELTYAAASGMTKILEAREYGVEFAAHLHGDRHHIKFVPTDIATLMLQIGKAVCEWKGGGDLKVKLLSETMIAGLWPLLRERRYRCSYVLRRNGRITRQETNAEIVREQQGLFIYIGAVPVDSFIELTIEFNGDCWVSVAKPVGALEVTMERE